MSYVTENPCQKEEVSQETAASTVEALVGAVCLGCRKDMTKARKALGAITLYQTTYVEVSFLRTGCEGDAGPDCTRQQRYAKMMMLE